RAPERRGELGHREFHKVDAGRLTHRSLLPCGTFAPCYTTQLGANGSSPMNLLLLGSGGREHALAWKIAGSPLVERLYCAPGNAGIAHECEIVALDPADHAAVIAFCKTHSIDLVVVGPEAPLCAGMVDDLAAAG